MYDHTIQGIKHNNTKFHFIKIGLRRGSINKTDYLQTMNEMIIENEHMNEKDMILKIDCEGCEWESFKDISQEIFEKFSQIIVEYHLSDLNDTAHYKLFVSVLEKINLTHQIYHIHFNNCGLKTNYGSFHKFSILEVSYVRKRGNVFKNDFNLYPVNGLDYTNCLNEKNYGYGLAGFFNFE